MEIFNIFTSFSTILFYYHFEKIKEDKMTIMNFERKGIDIQSLVLPNQKIYYLKATNEYFLSFQEYSARNKELILTNYTPLLTNMKANMYQCEEYDMQKSALLASLPFDHVLTIFSSQEFENSGLPQQSYLVGGLVKDSKGQYGIITQYNQSHCTICKLNNLESYQGDTIARKYYTVQQSLFDQQNVKSINISSLNQSTYPKFEQQNNLIIGMSYKYFKNDNYIKLFKNNKISQEEILRLILQLRAELIEKINGIRQAYNEKLNFNGQKDMETQIQIDNETYNLVSYDQIENKSLIPQDKFVDLSNPPTIANQHKYQRVKKNIEKQQVTIKPINEEERKLQAQVIKKLIFSDIKATMDQYFELNTSQTNTQLIENMLTENNEQSEQSDGINIDEFNEKADLLIQQSIDRDKVSSFREQVMLPLDFNDIQQTMQQWLDQQEDLDTTQVVTTKRLTQNDASILQVNENLKQFMKESIEGNGNILIDELGLQAIKAFQFISQYAELINCQHINCIDFLKAFTFNKNIQIIEEQSLFDQQQLKQIQDNHPELENIFPIYNKKINVLVYQLMTHLASFLFQTQGVEISDKRIKKRDFLYQLSEQGLIQQKVLDQYLKQLNQDEEDYTPSEDEEEQEEQNEEEASYESSSSSSSEQQSVSDYEPEEEINDSDQYNNDNSNFVVSSQDEQQEEIEEEYSEENEKVEQKQEDNEQSDVQNKETLEKVISLQQITTYKQLQTFYYKREVKAYINRGATDDIYIDRIVHFIISKLWQKCDYISLYRILPILYRISDNFAIKQMLCCLENKDTVQRSQFTNSQANTTLFDQMPIEFLNELFNTNGKYIEGSNESNQEQIQRQVQMLLQYESLPKCTFQDLDYKYQFELLNWLIDQVTQCNTFVSYCDSLQKAQQELSEQRKQLIGERQLFNQKESRVKREKAFNEETNKLRLEYQQLSQNNNKSTQDKEKYKQIQQELQQRNFKMQEQAKLQSIKNDIISIDDQINTLDLINKNLLITTDTLYNNYYYIDYDENHKILMFDSSNNCYRLLSCDTIKAMEPYIGSQLLMQWNENELNLDHLLQQPTVRTNYKPISELKQEDILQQRNINALLKQNDIPIQFNYMLDTTGYGFTFLDQQNLQQKLRQIWNV